MTRLLPICLPAAALLGAGAYLAADRAVLAEIGLAPGRDGLRAVSAAPVARPRVVAQSGPVCFDVLLWGGGAPLPLWPTDAPPAQSRTLAALVPAPGVSILPPGGVVPVVERVIATPPVAVPEPSSLALILPGAVVLSALLWSHRHV